MSVDLLTSRDETAERLANSAEMRVYPVGFTPDFKKLLRDAGIDFSQLGERSGAEILGLLTEEEIAVIFAKISRKPGGFLEVAKSVDEDGAAQFHQKWVVSVEGYGHASVAEHAMIHMAVENVSSLAGDEVTDNRLASYTEFSARFKGHQNVGYFTPTSVKEVPELSAFWHEVHRKIFKLNELLMTRGLAYVQSEEGRRKQPERRTDGAKGIKTVSDQVKNLMPASRLTSIGVTINAREAEHALRKFLSSPYPEVRQMGQFSKEESLKVAPTLVKYADENEYLVSTREKITGLIEEYGLESETYPEISDDGRLVRLLDYDPLSEEKFIAAALYRNATRMTYPQLLKIARSMSAEEKKQAFEVLLGGLDKHDVPIRMLEFAGDYKIEILGMTYGDWREWKRHRIETYDAKELGIDYGFMIPPLAYEMDESDDLQYHECADAIKEIMADVETLFYAVQKADPLAAQYCVTRLHYRPAIVKMNLREAFHLINLRTGPTAHPFIRRLAWQFFDEVKNVHPIFAEYLEKKLRAEGRPSREFVWTY